MLCVCVRVRFCFLHKRDHILCSVIYSAPSNLVLFPNSFIACHWTTGTQPVTALKTTSPGPAAQLVRASSSYTKVVGLILRQGAYKGQPVRAEIWGTTSRCLSLKINQFFFLKGLPSLFAGVASTFLGVKEDGSRCAEVHPVPLTWSKVRKVIGRQSKKSHKKINQSRGKNLII